MREIRNLKDDLVDFREQEILRRMEHSYEYGRDASKIALRATLEEIGANSIEIAEDFLATFQILIFMRIEMTGVQGLIAQESPSSQSIRSSCDASSLLTGIWQ